MKPIVWLVMMIVCLPLPDPGAAAKLYTWKDAQGVTHITNTPPPPNAQGQAVLEYRPRTAAELNAIEEEKKVFRKQFENKNAEQEALNARRKAQELRKEAADAEATAVAAQQKAEAFTKQASTNWRRYNKNKATILRLQREAEAARQEAQNAEELARSAEEKAIQTSERANNTSSPNSSSGVEATDNADIRREVLP